MLKQKTWQLVLAAAFILGVGVSFSGCDSAENSSADAESESSANSETTELFLISPEGDRHTFVVELATTNAEREKGLMFRRKLPENTGMLFVWDTKDIRRMWMKNTYISLDMLFMNGNRIVDIVTYATPESLDILGPDKLVDRVLEVPAGTVEELGITKQWHIEVVLPNAEDELLEEDDNEGIPSPLEQPDNAIQPAEQPAKPHPTQSV